MAVCPKCEKKIPIYHLGQTCPHCGVNVRFYDFDKTFYRDAKRAELSVAKINIFIAHVKASFIGSNLPIIRLCFMLLPLLSVLAPYANAQIVQPFLDGKIALSGLGLYLAFTGGYVDYVLAMMKGGIDSQAFTAMVLVIAVIAVIAVLSLLQFLLTVLAFTSIKKMPKALCTISALGMLAAVAAAVLSFRFVSVCEASDGSLISGSMSFGYVITIIAFAANFIINLLIIKNGLNIVYKEGDLERAEIAARVKSGEINLDDLPQPIVETEETKLIDLEIEKQQALYRKQEGGAPDEEI